MLYRWKAWKTLRYTAISNQGQVVDRPAILLAFIIFISKWAMDRYISVLVLDRTITTHLGVNIRNMVSRLASRQACVFIICRSSEMILRDPGNLPGKACDSWSSSADRGGPCVSAASVGFRIITLERLPQRWAGLGWAWLGSGGHRYVHSICTEASRS